MRMQLAPKVLPVAVLVESNQCSHRDTCCFQSDEEHQEVSCGNHEVHTQQGRERQHIKFALLDYSVRSFKPLMCHQENNQRTDAEDGLHDALYRGVIKNTIEQNRKINAQKIKSSS